MLIATITQEAFERLNHFCGTVMVDRPSGCSGREFVNHIIEIHEGSIPVCDLSEVMILNGQKMIVFVSQPCSFPGESACCAWSQVVFEKIA